MSGILCVSAHPDDESFVPAGTLACYATQGIPVDLLTFTPGQAGYRPTAIETPEALGLLRTHELRAAAKVLGVRHLDLLDYVDGELDRVDTEVLARHVIERLEESGADVLMGPGPIGITRHPDHIAAYKAMMAAAERIERPIQVFYLAVASEWAEQLNVDGVEAQPTHEIDIADFFETKLDALACHSSQEDSRQFFMLLTNVRPLVEHFHRAVPAAAPGRMYHDLFEG